MRWKLELCLNLNQKVINHTVPSGSISNKCFGVCACNPVRTYCPGFPCDSRTKKSPSCLSNTSAACRLIDAWNHCSVSSCDLCTSADSENGSTEIRETINLVNRKRGDSEKCESFTEMN